MVANLPHLEGRFFLTDGGLETTLIFQDGIELPHFAAFHLLSDADGRSALERYYERYIAIAKSAGVGFILESPTWRASRDWGEKLGYSREAIEDANCAGLAMMHGLRDRHRSADFPMVVSGCVGPRGDGYDAGQVMSPAEAEDYHAHQIGVLADAGADMIAAFTMTNANEPIGIARAAGKVRLPVVISFTLETDGRLPTGQSLADAIGEVDRETGSAPAYYMINCAHPSHFADVLPADANWAGRIRGIRANASMRSHRELNDAPDLDAGDPADLGERYRALLSAHPHINVLGGCCGTDHRHIECISSACLSAPA